jgi:hypothetical protein
MKSLGTLLVLCLASCLAVAAPPKSNSPRIRGLHTVSAFLVLNSFDYNEDFPPPGKSSEDGWLFGMGFHYTYKGGSQLPW